MRGRKQFNIRNVEAHLGSFRPQTEFIRNDVTTNQHISELQKQNEFINAKFGVSKYASNLVSGRMFTKL